MVARSRYPTDHELMLDVRPAYGWFDDFATVVGTRRPDAGGCWCMSYRDSRDLKRRAVSVHADRVQPGRAA
jgi:hypothetical protein